MRVELIKRVRWGPAVLLTVVVGLLCCSAAAQAGLAGFFGKGQTKGRRDGAEILATVAKALNPLDKGKILLLGAYKAAEQAGKMIETIQKTAGKIRTLEAKVSRREPGWRAAAVKVTKLEDRVKELKAELKEKRAHRKALRNKAVRFLKPLLKKIQSVGLIKKHHKLLLLFGKALMEEGGGSEAASVFKKVEEANVSKTITKSALRARIRALDKEAQKVKLPKAPDPSVQKGRPPRKPLPRNLNRLHGALKKYLKLYPKDPRSAYYAYWIGTHRYLFRRYREARSRFWWVIHNHCRTKTSLEAGRLVLQSVILEKGKTYLQRLSKTVRKLRGAKCWRRRRCKSGDAACRKWSRAVGKWMLDLAQVEDRVDKKLKAEKKRAR